MSGSRQGVADLPGFDTSLVLLIRREQYSMTDIAAMFGVSRQRIEQLCERRGLTYPDGTYRGMMAMRVWDDAQHCFRPMSRGEFRREAFRRAVEARRQKRLAEERTRQADIVRHLGELKLSLGRDPSWYEMARSLGIESRPSEPNCMYVLRLWCSRKIGTRDRLAHFRAMTGMGARGAGKRTAPSRSPDRSPSNG